MIQAVVKVGGSLSQGEHLPALGKRLSEVGKHHPLLVVPGGGPFADTVRILDGRHNLGDSAAHWMAILGMDQYGWLLSELVPRSVPVWSLAAARSVSQAGRVPILLPWRLLYETDPLPHSWQVTSDSIAAWVAGEVQAPRLVLLKNVDGLFGERQEGTNRRRLLERVAVERLGRSGMVDDHLSGLVDQYGWDLWLINGQRPERLAELLSAGTTMGTRVLRERDVGCDGSGESEAVTGRKKSAPIELAAVQ